MPSYRYGRCLPILIATVASKIPFPARAERAVPWLARLDSRYDLHPICVEFTVALFITSVLMDLFAGWTSSQGLLSAAAWNMLVAGCITPLTSLLGFFFWMHDDQTPTSNLDRMTIHMWLGSALAIIFISIGWWRWRDYRQSRRPGPTYRIIAAILLIALVYQAYLGGYQSFNTGM